MKTKYIIFITLLNVCLIANSSNKHQIINATNFDIYPVSANEDDIQKKARWNKIRKAFLFCIEKEYDLFFPEGIYDVGARNFPFRSIEGSIKILDCKNITIFGEGEKTIFMTSSIKGADVLQLNMVKNLKIRDLYITAKQDGFKNSGSNGISITNGWDNISLENIVCYDLPGVDKRNWIDGGKALTIQFGNDVKSKKGKIIAKNITSLNNAYGFRFDGAHIDEIVKWAPDINIDIYVKRAYQGVSISFGKARKNIDFNKKLNLKINAKLIDCQQSIVMARVIGGEYNFILDKTLAYNSMLLDNNKKKWTSSDDRVFSYMGQAPKKVDVKITGNADIVDFMVLIGAIGNIVEPYNFINQTEESIFNINLKGQSLKKNIFIIEDMKKQSFYNTIIYINQELLSKENPFNKIKSEKKLSVFIQR